ncbi:MAG: hypothetical protein K0B06_07815 [Brevefilum sp.]|nr:hypothetical protein [Brevefilum sp.]
MKNTFTEDLIRKILSAKEAHIIQPVKIGQTDQQNELVFFIKPELFEVDDPTRILNSLMLIEEKFSAYQVKVDGTVILPGNVLAEHEIMNRHYGFINQLSRMASQMVSGEIRAHLFETLNIKDDGTYQILGGHEFQQTYQVSVDALSDIWFSQGAKKLRSGFYVVADTYQGDPFILVNGFHPSQLAHYTREDHRILLMLIHTDTDWYDLKFDLVGDTFPENAKPDSIRGQLFAHPELYGQDDVGINSNGVHLSAGPFEAAFEVVNFFGDILSLDPQHNPPLAIQSAIDMGADHALALSFLDNPAIGESDLFSKTENLNTQDAVQFAMEHLSDD